MQLDVSIWACLICIAQHNRKHGYQRNFRPTCSPTQLHRFPINFGLTSHEGRKPSQPFSFPSQKFPPNPQIRISLPATSTFPKISPPPTRSSAHPASGLAQGKQRRRSGAGSAPSAGWVIPLRWPSHSGLPRLHFEIPRHLSNPLFHGALASAVAFAG